MLYPQKFDWRVTLSSVHGLIHVFAKLCHNNLRSHIKMNFEWECWTLVLYHYSFTKWAKIISCFRVCFKWFNISFWSDKIFFFPFKRLNHHLFFKPTWIKPKIACISLLTAFRTENPIFSAWNATISDNTLKYPLYIIAF